MEARLEGAHPDADEDFKKDFAGTQAAREEALKGCRESVQEAFGKDVDTQCQLVMENDQLVWTGEIPRPMTERYLPESDLPLARANVFGDIASAKGLVLALHGCDGQADPQDEWYNSWLDFFVDRQYAVISPSSLADQQELVCGDDIPDVGVKPFSLLFGVDRQVALGVGWRRCGSQGWCYLGGVR